MSEDHHIISDAHGEPAGRVGVRMRVQLSGCPSGRWSRALSAHLCEELVGHPGVGHLQLDQIVQGDQIVLEGIEASEAPALAASLRRAVDASNHAPTGGQNSPPNVAQQEADSIAPQVTLRRRFVPTSVRSASDIGERDQVTPSRWFG